MQPHTSQHCRFLGLVLAGELKINQHVNILEMNGENYRLGLRTPSGLDEHWGRHKYATRPTASIEMTDGTTFALTEAVAETVRRAALVAGSEVQVTLPANASSVIVGVNVVVGQGRGGGGPEGGSVASSTTLANVVVRLIDPELRDWPVSAFETA